MRQLVWIFLVSCSLASTFAQQDNSDINNQKWQWGVRSGLYTTIYVNDKVYHGQVTARKGKHELAIGPSFGRRPYFYPYNSHTYDDSYKFNGVDLSYRIYPNGQGKIFDFYFQLDMLQKWGNGNYTDYIYNYPNPEIILTDEVKIKSTASVMIIEYGFDIKFLKHFYLGVSAGYGGQLQFQTFKYETYDDLNSNHSFFRIDYIARANVGFRF